MFKIDSIIAKMFHLSYHLRVRIFYIIQISNYYPLNKLLVKMIG